MGEHPKDPSRRGRRQTVGRRGPMEGRRGGEATHGTPPEEHIPPEAQGCAPHETAPHPEPGPPPADAHEPGPSQG